jgi:hypothetical protein
MKSLSVQCAALGMVFAIGCAGDPPVDDEEMVSTATSALVAGTWQQVGHETCLDMCGFGGCGCINDRCPASPNGGSPQGDFCNTAGDTCFFISGNGNDVLEFECTGPARAILTVAAGCNGSVTGTGISCPGDCTGDYAVGTNVTLTATPAAGHQFFRWSAGCGVSVPTANPITVNMSVDRKCAATFIPNGF